MFVSRVRGGLPYNSSTHRNIFGFRFDKNLKKGAGSIPKGSTTGLYSAKYHEITPPRLIWNNRIVARKNFSRRNQWKKEHAHHLVHKHVYSRRRQLFPIAEKNQQRYEFFPTRFVFPVHHEPFNNYEHDNQLWIPHKRDPTVRNAYPSNYVRLHMSEDMTKYELIEYMKRIYNVDLKTVEIEKVDEQNVLIQGETERYGRSMMTVDAINQDYHIAHNDRFKIAHCTLNQPFKYPDFQKPYAEFYEEAKNFNEAVIKLMKNNPNDLQKIRVKVAQKYVKECEFYRKVLTTCNEYEVDKKIMIWNKISILLEDENNVLIRNFVRESGYELESWKIYYKMLSTLAQIYKRDELKSLGKFLFLSKGMS